MIDWWASWLVAYLIWGAQPWGTLGVFALQNVVLLATVGATFGHRLAGLQVVRTGARSDLPAATGTPVPATPERSVTGIGVLAAAIRTLLLCLVLPAVVWDADGRGLHDRGAGTAIVRR